MSVIAPHNSMTKSSVKPKASRSELSIASANSMLLRFLSDNSQILVAEILKEAKLIPTHLLINKVYLPIVTTELPSSVSFIPIKLSKIVLIFSTPSVMMSSFF